MNSGFVFYTNYDSAKGRDLAENPRASLLFFWRELERQVRINGSVTKTTQAESDAVFPFASDRESDQRGDLGSEPPGRRSFGARTAVCAVRGDAQRLAGPAAGQLGWVSRQAGRNRVLAGPQEPPARSAALYAAGGRIVDDAIADPSAASDRSIARRRPSPTFHPPARA